MTNRPTGDDFTVDATLLLTIFRVGDVELGLDGRQVWVAGEPKHLPPREFHMLSILMDNVGRDHPPVM